MRKGLVAILAVAIIGALGIYGKDHTSSAKTVTKPSSSSTPESTAPATTSETSSSSINSNGYKDGTYIGREVDTVYGPVQIKAIISGGKIIDVKFVTMPDDLGHTREVTNESEPLLKEETLAKQSAHIDFVSGATQTSEGYQQSLQTALDQAV
ncbi:FMN-binding protein [Candidatus Saccharibacteria bacterium]|nr:FMN-binding protein [Candidatus Saccharibacteria bacterium]